MATMFYKVNTAFHKQEPLLVQRQFTMAAVYTKSDMRTM